MDQLVEKPLADTVVLYQDEVDFGRYPPTGDDWAEKGCQEKIRTRGKNKKRYIFGARDAHTGQLYMRWARRKTGACFVEFLKSLVAQFPGKRVIMILDNFGVHKCRRVEEWQEESQAALRRVFLPTYSPWLNRIEDTWRILKRRVHVNTWRDTTREIVKDVSQALLQMGAVLLHPTLSKGST